MCHSLVDLFFICHLSIIIIFLILNRRALSFSIMHELCYWYYCMCLSISFWSIGSLPNQRENLGYVPTSIRRCQFSMRHSIRTSTDIEQCLKKKSVISMFMMYLSLNNNVTTSFYYYIYSFFVLNDTY
jgi:hypothetical protein